MKKITIIFAALCIMLICGTAYGYSSDEMPFADYITTTSKGVLHTVIVDTEGETHYLDGTFTVDELKNSAAVPYVSSYSVYMDEKELFKTELHNIVSDNVSLFGISKTEASGGYYSIEFDFSSLHCFLTGLTDDNAQAVHEAIIAAASKGTEFELTHTDFIDAEKLFVDENDDELCWAASASNILHYTGWADKAFEDKNNTELNRYAKNDSIDEDGLFNLFIGSFDDNGGSTYYGLPWFFDGHYLVQDRNGWSHVNTNHDGGYLKKYDIHRLMEKVEIYDFTDTSYVFEKIEEGCGVEVSLGWYSDANERSGGHAITCWGYVVDTSLAPNDKRYYKSIIVSDSDSDKGVDDAEGNDRANAPNKLYELKLTSCKAYGYDRNGDGIVAEDEKFDSWYSKNYLSNNSKGVIEEFVILQPYSSSLEYEEDGGATPNRKDNPDFAAEIYSEQESFRYDEYIRLTIDALYYSLVDFNGTLTYRLEIKNKADNSIVYSPGEKVLFDFSAQSISTHNWYSRTEFIPCTNYNLKPGEYTATITLNPNKSFAEAYYYQNTASVDFSIVDSIAVTGVGNNTVNGAVFIHMPAEKNISVIVTGYDNNGVLKKCDMIRNIKPTKNGQEEGKYVVLFNKEVLGCDTMRVMLCEADDIMKPLCSSKDFILQ